MKSCVFALVASLLFVTSCAEKTSESETVYDAPEPEVHTAEQVLLFVDNKISGDKLEALLVAVQYLEDAWADNGYDEKFDIRLIDYDEEFFDCTTRDYYRTITIHPVPSFADQPFGFARWIKVFGSNQWKGDITYKTINASTGEFETMFLHELGHVFGLGHVDDPTNAMNGYPSSTGFALTDDQLDQIEANIFGNLPKYNPELVD